MPWQKLKPKRGSAETATLRRHGVALSGEFVKSNNLTQYQWVELFIDDTLRRIGFKFKDDKARGVLKLAKKSKHGRVIGTRLLQRYA